MPVQSSSHARWDESPKGSVMKIGVTALAGLGDRAISTDGDAFGNPDVRMAGHALNRGVFALENKGREGWTVKEERPSESFGLVAGGAVGVAS